MARSRNIKPGFFVNEDLLELSFEYRLLFAGIWTLADREGRLEDRPKKIKLAIFPGDPVDVDAGLNALVERGFIQRYAVDGKRYIAVITWDKHQSPHVKEAASTIPAPDSPGASTSAAALIPSSLIPDSSLLIPDSSSLRSQAPAVPSPDPVDVKTVFQYWQKVHGHPNAELDKKRRARIVEGLKKYTAEELCNAVDGYRHSPHHMGTDPKGNGTKYDDIELFLRDAKRIDAGLQMFNHPPRPPPEKKVLSAVERVRLANGLEKGDERVVSEQNGQHRSEGLGNPFGDVWPAPNPGLRRLGS